LYHTIDVENNLKKDKRKKNEVTICKKLGRQRTLKGRRLHRRNTSGVVSVLATSL